MNGNTLPSIAVSAGERRKTEKQQKEEEKELERSTFKIAEDMRKRAFSAAEIMEISDKAGGIQWLVPGLIVKGLNLLTGKPDTAKTFTAVDMARCVATGTPWMGLPVMRTPVLYIDEELGRVALGARMKQIGIKGTDPFYVHSRQGYKVNEPEDIRRIMEDIKKHRIGLVIFDSLISVHDYQESDNSDMRKIRENVRPILEKGVAILFIHHNRKSSGSSNWHSLDDVRGAGDIGGMMDNGFSIVKTGSATFRLSSTKLRHIPDKDAVTLTYRLQSDEKREHVTLVKADPENNEVREEDATRKQILEALREAGGELKSGDLTGRFTMRASTVKAIADRMAEEDVIEREVRKGRGAPIYYKLKGSA